MRFLQFEGSEIGRLSLAYDCLFLKIELLSGSLLRISDFPIGARKRFK